MGYKSFREQAGEGGQINSAWQTSYSKVFIIEVDSPTDSVYFVGSHPQLPTLYSPHPADPRAWCVSIAPQQDSQNPLIWRVACQWSMTLDSAGMGGMPTSTGNPYVDSQQQGKAPADRNTKPLLRGNDYSYNTISIGNEAVEYDTVTNQPIQNTAGQPFERVPEREIFCLEVTIGRNLPGAPNSDWDMLNGRLNKNAITVGTRACAARTVRMMSTSAQLVYEDTTAYWRWTHRLIIRPTAADWKWKVVNKGTRGICPFIDTPGGAIQYRMWNTNERPFKLQGHQFLDRDSYVIALNTGKTMHTLEFDYLREADFPTVL